MSWVVRSVLKAFRRRYPDLQGVHVPIQAQQETTVRMNVCFYGDKRDYLLWCWNHGFHLGPTVRQAVYLWLAGELEVDFSESSVKFAKPEKSLRTKHRKTKTGYASAYQIRGHRFQAAEFWPPNRLNNLSLMRRGLANRKHPLPKG